jgi:ribosomal protein S6--L-glutamate ligase
LAGVDLLPGCDGRLYALEVNAVPGWRALGRTLDLDVAALVLEYVAQRAISGGRDRHISRDV